MDADLAPRFSSLRRRIVRGPGAAAITMVALELVQFARIEERFVEGSVPAGLQAGTAWAGLAPGLRRPPGSLLDLQAFFLDDLLQQFSILLQ